MKKSVCLAIGFAALIQVSSVVYSAEQGSKPKVVETVLEQAGLADGEELRLMLVEIQPGVSTAAHTHPVVGVCYVIEGTAQSQYEGEPLETYHAGQSFQGPAIKKHLVFKNASKTDVLKFTCTAKIKKGQPYLQPL